MTFDQPPRLRLKDSPELGAVIRAAGEAKVTPERLAANAANVKALIVAGASTALWKLLLPLLALLALLAPVVLHYLRSEAPVVASAPPPPAVVVVVPPDAAVIVEPDAEVLVDAPDAPVAPAPVVHRRPQVVIDAGVPVDAPPPKSELAAQIVLYQAARDAGSHGDPTHGIALIDELLQQYPDTPLRTEADLTRADFLARANRLDEAARALESLIADPAHGGRRGELLRTLGDLYRRQGDCARAIAAYDRALAERLGDRDRADVTRGRDRCTHP